MTFKNWQEWHAFMKRLGAHCTIDRMDFLTEGGCPKCGCKTWTITSDGWAYCEDCGYGQSQDFEISEKAYTYTLKPHTPKNRPPEEKKKRKS